MTNINKIVKRSGVYLLVVLLSWIFVSPSSFTPKKFAGFLNNGRISPPLKEMKKSGYLPYAHPWNLEDRLLSAVMTIENHLVVNGGDYLMVTAPEFGVNLALAWFPKLKIAVYNPLVIAHSDKKIVCHDTVLGVPVQHEEYEWVVVQYIDKKKKIHETEFRNTYSCLVNLFIAM